MPKKTITTKRLPAGVGIVCVTKRYLTQMIQTTSQAVAHFLSPSLCLRQQVFPRWFCWTQRVTWSRDRAAWRCWTTQSAGSSPGTPGPCWSSASPTLCSFTRGPASSCLWVSGWAFMTQPLQLHMWLLVRELSGIYTEHIECQTVENSSSVKRSVGNGIYLYANTEDAKKQNAAGLWITSKNYSTWMLSSGENGEELNVTVGHYKTAHHQKRGCIVRTLRIQDVSSVFWGQTGLQARQRSSL